MWKTVRPIAIIGCAFVLTGCFDHPSPAAPEPSGGLLLPPGGPRGAMAPDGYEAPVYDTQSDVPSEWVAKVITANSSVRFEGSLVRGFATMDFYGNRGEQTLNLTVLRDFSTVARESQPELAGYFLPNYRSLGTPMSYRLPRDCGQTANLTTQHVASIVIIIVTSVQQTSTDGRLSRADAAQPECECGGNTEITPVVYEPGYDPYSSGGGSGDCGGDGGGDGKGGGSGTQYEPGDYTGGETVDWQTGEGNGGESACGQEAVVEWVCVEILIGGEWSTWDCGYATTCGFR